MSKQRLEGFSDGIIAVAITALALNLAVAGPATGTFSASSAMTGRHSSPT